MSSVIQFAPQGSHYSSFASYSPRVRATSGSYDMPNGRVTSHRLQDILLASDRHLRKKLTRALASQALAWLPVSAAVSVG